ncbi:hypothetical protein DTW90_32510 [Neorhizobium sp. P12A]|uniref:hypothetical protein n=1 Tax=Neorhizobium sp. P12A TaxID=2268027 RepID=UPI0011EE61DF|nr:hypothetical protein [Neorhizobium sp. P12A]KAA0688135.1 hypothetical protein DTW90_32510 [Neorhizobium sp. P12A]
MSENLELMGDIASVIINSRKMGGVDWSEISIAVTVDESGEANEIFGYTYDASGNYTAVAPRLREIEQPEAAYWQWLRNDGKKGFQKILFQFNRTSRRVNADFEHEDPGRWQVTPNNVDSIIAQLRPNLGE